MSSNKKEIVFTFSDPDPDAIRKVFLDQGMSLTWALIEQFVGKAGAYRFLQRSCVIHPSSRGAPFKMHYETVVSGLNKLVEEKENGVSMKAGRYTDLVENHRRETERRDAETKKARDALFTV